MRENDSAGPQHRYKKFPWGVGPMFPRFTEKNIGDDRLGQIIDSARLAPSEWNLQSKRWIVVRADAAKKQLETATYLRVPLSSAPVIVICLADTLAWKSAPQYFQAMIAGRKISEEEGRELLRRLRDYYSSSPEVARRTALADAFLSVGQIIRGAADHDVSAYCIAEFDEAQIKTHFHVPDHFLVAALIPLGHHGESPEPPASMLLLRSVVYKEKFGEPLGPAV
jgi:nitroreductase